MKKRTCKICKEKFEPNPNMFCPPTCSKMDCMVEYSEKHLKKKRIEVKKASRKALKDFNDSDIKEVKKKAVVAFNAFIRKRDEKLPCISCGHIDGRQFHAGHYKPAGGFSYLMFNEKNCHKQCSICNNHLSANLINYRVALIKKIGQGEVNILELPNQLKKWTIEELHNIVKVYREKLKTLE